MRAISAALLGLIVAMGAACGPSGDDNGDGIPDLPDADGDNIADVHEGRDENRDTDGDGTPDYLDADSDGDGISDLDEAGDDLSGTPPLDSDADGIPDFVDLDADENGIPDGVGTDTTDDIDGDGLGNWKDLDDDGDSIDDVTELEGSPDNPPDLDGDGRPNFQDDDSDGDDIKDFHEGVVDTDMDGVPAYLDDDSDGDCRPDQLESGDNDKTTPPIDTDGDTLADFLDLDSDNDGLSDAAEDANCNGVTDPTESSATNDDSDGDGVTDLIEDVAGTNPLDPNDNPQNNGDFVFLVPYQDPPNPNEDDLGFSTNLEIVDLYVLIDRSGSMSSEINSVRNNLATAINNVTCAPLGNGTAGNCISDLWSGAGTIGYAGGESYTNHLDIQPNPALTGPSIPTNEPGGCCQEPLTLATWSVATGGGSADAGCSLGASYGARASCASSPAGPGGIGYPCFRPNALPVILFSTDEAISGSDTYHCPAMSSTVSAVNAIGGKIIGIRGQDAEAALLGEMQTMATQTGAVDASNNPLVFDGADANQVNAIEDAIRTLANGIPLDVSASPIDDGSDSVDAVTAFVDHLETLQLGTAACANGLTDQDSNGDGFPDLFVSVTSGTPVCWKLVPKQNTTVMPTSEPQLFRATVEVRGDGVTLLDTRDVFFLVPPEISGPKID